MRDVLRAHPAVVISKASVDRWALVGRFDPPVTDETEFIVPEGIELDPKLAL